MTSQNPPAIPSPTVPPINFEKLMPSILHIVPLAMLIQGKKGEILEVTPATEKLFGLEAKELIGRKLSEFFVEYVPDKLNKSTSYDENKTVEMILKRPDGTKTDVEVSPYYDIEPGFHLFSLRDITEQKNLSNQLHHQSVILQNIKDAVISTDNALIITTWNNAAESIYGWTAQEAFGKNLISLLNTGNNENGREGSNTFKAGDCQKGEHFFTHKDGRSVLVEVSTTPLYDNGELTGYVSIHRDLAERKFLEEELLEKAEELETLLNLVPAAVVIAEDADCQLIYGNKMANELFEAKDNENISAKVTSNRKFFREGKELTAEELPMINAVSHNQEIRNTELDVLLPSGKLKNILGSASPLYDSQRRIRSCIGAFIDITSRKKTEEALRENEHRLNLIIGNSPDTMFLQDSELRTVWIANPFGPFKGIDVNGKTDSDILGQEEAKQLMSIKRKVISSGKGIQTDIVLDFNGDRRCLDIVFVPWKDEHAKIIGLFGYIRDITERKLLQSRVEQLHREQMAFMRHELSNLFTPMKIYVGSLGYLTDNLTEKQIKVLDQMKENVKRISDFINNLKFITNFELGEYKLNKKLYPLNKVLMQAIDTMHPVAEKDGVTIMCFIPEKEEKIEIDIDFLPGVFINLILNAIEHVATLQDQKEKIVMVDFAKNSEFYIISINNRGKPVPQERLGTFFEKFNYGPEKQTGTGLGTTYAYLVTKAHGGEIKADSNAEDGTTVTIKFPRK